METTLTPRKLAEGVYALVSSTADTNNPAGIPEATTGGIIVGEKGVLVIESMLNAKLANQVLDQVSHAVLVRTDQCSSTGNALATIEVHRT
jgi:hypothetical protein